MIDTAQSEIEVPPSDHRSSFQRWLLLIALASLLLRWGWVAAAKTDLLESLGVANGDCVVPGEPMVPDGTPEHCDEPPMGDAIYYSAQSVWIADGRWFTHPTEIGPDGRPAEAADHAPLTAVALVPASLLGGSDALLEQRLLMSLYGVAVVVAVGLLGRRVAGDHAGLLAAALAAVNPNLWMNDVLPMSETFAALGVSVVLLLVYRFGDRPSAANAAWVGVASGVTVLARAELGMLLPLVMWPVCWWARSLRPGVRVGRAALATAVAVAVALPWTAYNLSRFDEPVLFSTNDGLTLIGANCDNTYGDGVGFWNLNCAFAVATPPGADQSVRSKIYRDAALTYIGDHLDELPRVAAIRLARVWGVYPPHQMVYLNTGEGRETGASWAGFVAWWVMAPLSVAGLWVLHRRRQMIWPFLATGIAVCVTAVLFYGIVRFRLPADVAGCVLAAVAIDAVLRRSRSAADEAARRPPPADSHPATDHADFPALDGYRAIGMTLVLLFHTAFATGFDKRPGVGRYLARMDVGVAMFFVLSAFLLYRPMVGALLTNTSARPPTIFWRRRALRILPAYWAALALIPLAGAVGLTPGLPSADAGEWFINVFLLQGFGARAPYLITQAWAIGVEVGFYLVLPLYGMWCARRLASRPQPAQVRWMLAGVAAWYVAGQALRAFVVVAEPAWGTQSLLWLPMYADLFAIGMGLAVLSAAATTGRPLPRVISALAAHPALCWVGALLAFAAISQVDPPDTPFTIGGGELLVRQFTYGIVALLWLIPGFFAGPSEGRLRAALRSRPLAALGTVSLSFYLWHIAFIDQAKSWTIPGYEQLEGLATFQGSLLRVVAIAFVCTAATAALLYRFVELPFLRLKDDSAWAVGRRAQARIRARRDADPTGGTPIPPSNGERDHAGVST